MLIFPDHSTLSATIIFILAVVFLSYLSVVWDLAFVVSVLEEKCGIDALGRAAELVKGLKLNGFFSEYCVWNTILRYDSGFWVGNVPNVQQQTINNN